MTAISSPFPPHIVAFVNREIKSAFRLDILLLLARTPGVGRSVASVAGELRLDPRGAAGELKAMAAARLIVAVVEEEETRYCYRPGSEELRRVVEDLAVHYAQRPTTLISLIYAAPEEPRTDEKMWRFADAFKLRKP